jgi:hypothetical protein
VFEEQKDIANTAFFAQVNEALLQAQADSVVDGAELEHGNHEIMGHGFSRINTNQKKIELFLKSVQIRGLPFRR